MKKLICFIICILIMLQMVACHDTLATERSSTAEPFADDLVTTTTAAESEPTETSPTVVAEPEIVAGDVTFTVGEIKKQLEEAFCVMVYLNGDNKLSEYIKNGAYFSHEDVNYVDFIEYDLYYRPYRETNHFITPAVILYEKNIKAQDETGRIAWGFTVTEKGIHSYISFGGGDVDPSYYVETYGDSYIGSYTMDLSNVTKPEFETVTEDWKDNTRSELCLYMDKNISDLPQGKYQVYVKGIWESDKDSEIFFEHENGDVYRGFYYFVHHPQKDTLANLNHVNLLEYTNIQLERYKETAAFYMEYEVK